MKNISSKVFQEDGAYFILPILLDNYYGQIKQYKSEGYNQVILTADVLLEIVKKSLHFIPQKF